MVVDLTVFTSNIQLGFYLFLVATGVIVAAPIDYCADTGIVHDCSFLLSNDTGCLLSDGMTKGCTEWMAHTDFANIIPDYNVLNTGSEFVLKDIDSNAVVAHTSSDCDQCIFVDVTAERDAFVGEVSVENVSDGLVFKGVRSYTDLNFNVNDWNLNAFVDCSSITDNNCTYRPELSLVDSYKSCNSIDLNAEGKETKRCFYNDLLGSHLETKSTLADYTSSDYRYLSAGSTLRYFLNFRNRTRDTLKFDFCYYVNNKKFCIDPFIDGGNFAGGDLPGVDFNRTGERSGGFFGSYWDGNLSILGELDYNTQKSYPEDYDVNLIGYWKFNDNNGTHVLDETSNNHDGNLNGGADTNALGLWDTNAGFFDGVDGYVDFSDSSDWDFGNNNFTIAVWIKTTTASNVFIINNWTIVDNFRSWLLQTTSGKIDFHMSTSGSGVTDTVSSNSTINDGRWHHVMVIRNGNTQLMYVDGVVQADTGSISAALKSNTVMRIGARTGSPPINYFDGLMDEVKIYNRALTAAEVEVDFNAWFESHYYSEVLDANVDANWNNVKWTEDGNYGGSDRDAPGKDVNLLAYWTFDAQDTNATHTLDLTSNNNDANFNGGMGINSIGIWSDTNAGNFDGINDYMLITDSDIVESGDTQLSVFGWVKAPVPNSNNEFVIGQWDVGNNQKSWQINAGAIGTGGGRGAIRVFLSTDGSAGIGFDAGTVILDGEWHHIGFTFNGNQASGSRIKIYYDGVETGASGTDVASLFNSDVDITIGARKSGGAFDLFFDAEIDEFRIYDRALSNIEVKLLSSAGHTNIRMQVRSCSDVNCATGGEFVGSDGTGNTSFDIGNQFHDVLTIVDANRYFQYKATFDTNNIMNYPYLADVNIEYTEVIVGVAPDVNLSQIDGFDLNNATIPFFDANIVADQNLTIKFFVQDNDDDRLTVDINATNLIDINIVIIEDLNLDSAICDDINFSDMTSCTWDWNIFAVPDNNYYLLIQISDGSNIDANVSDNNFAVNHLFDINFSVFQATGLDFDLNNISLDFNVDAYDVSGVNSRFDHNIGIGHYTVTVTKPTWDENTSFFVDVDSDKTVTIYIDKFIYPKVFELHKTGTATTGSGSYQTVQTSSYDTNFGVSTTTGIGCSFWGTASEDNKDIGWRIQTSDNGINWTTRDETTNSVINAGQAVSVFMNTNDFNIADGNHFFRLQHKKGSGGSYDVNTSNLCCVGFFARDQNDLIIGFSSDDVTGEQATTGTFTEVGSHIVKTSEFNGFLLAFGNIDYSQTGGDSNANILWSLLDQNTHQYPRFMPNTTSGIGAHVDIFTDLNQDTDYNISHHVKTSAGTTTFDYAFNQLFINQKPNEFFDIDLNGLSTSDTDFNAIVTQSVTLETQHDFVVLASMPFSCTEPNCLMQAKIGVNNGGFDENSLVMNRTTTNPGDIGIAILIHAFDDVPSTDINITLYIKTDKGTINLEGGGFTKFKANHTITITPLPPQDPLILAPDNNSFASGTNVDYNCFSTDPNSTLEYDVNLLFDVNKGVAIELQVDGNGSGKFDSTLVPDENYTFACNVQEVGTIELFSADFNNSDFRFTIDNTAPTTTIDFNADQWQNFDANIAGAMIICDDIAIRGGSGCANTAYRKDTDPSVNISFGDWISGTAGDDLNIVLDLDGNWAVDFNSTDVQGNIEDTNQIYVLIDKTTPDLNFVAPTTIGATISSAILKFDVNFIGGSDININATDVNVWVVGNGETASTNFNPVTRCTANDSNFNCSYTETLTTADYNFHISVCDQALRTDGSTLGNCQDFEMFFTFQTGGLTEEQDERLTNIENLAEDINAAVHDINALVLGIDANMDSVLALLQIDILQDDLNIYADIGFNSRFTDVNSLTQGQVISFRGAADTPLTNGLQYTCSAGFLNEGIFMEAIFLNNIKPAVWNNEIKGQAVVPTISRQFGVTIDANFMLMCENDVGNTAFWGITEHRFTLSSGVKPSTPSLNPNYEFKEKDFHIESAQKEKPEILPTLTIPTEAIVVLLIVGGILIGLYFLITG